MEGLGKATIKTVAYQKFPKDEENCLGTYAVVIVK